MNEIVYRSIFPNNNIPLMEVPFKNITIKEKLTSEINLLMDNVDFDTLIANISKLELAVEEKKDPIKNLLNLIREKSK